MVSSQINLPAAGALPRERFVCNAALQLILKCKNANSDSYHNIVTVFSVTLSTASDSYLTATLGKSLQALTRHQLSTGIALASYEFQSASIAVPVSFWRQGEGLLIGGLGTASIWLLDYDNHWLQDLLHEKGLLIGIVCTSFNN